ncbi:unnamed protein product [Prorocentrum cordatum]|uniref:Uncharacterized protein n=1 Tax=Prorocentrum cordatum TaxID=2364126 RepID=A0ABN9SA46_9DINO|nr:unnamed protein product [Polarella glacialis]
MLSEMSEAKLKPNVISYSSGICACEKGEQWQQALALLNEMREAKLELDGVQSIAGVSACGKGEQWQRGLALLSEMRMAKLEPNVFFSYRGGISACERGKQWQRALSLLREMREAKVEPDIFCYPRWDQCLREGRAVADGTGAAERSVGGEAGAHRDSATALRSARAGRASSGRRHYRC